MISSIAPISESLIIVGKSDSSLYISQFPTCTPLQGDSLLDPSPLRPLHSSLIGKCSRSPVGDLSHRGDTFAAVSAATLSLWDPIQGSRLRHWSTADISTACHHMTSDLVAVAGHDCSVHFYDTRGMGSKPIWSLQISRDNLYTLCGAGHTLFAAGADGYLYKLDLRNGRKEHFDFLQNVENTSSSTAILDVSISDASIVSLFETGEVVSIEMSSAAEKVTFAKSVSPVPFTTQIGCDAYQTSSTLHMAIGSGQGHVNYFTYNAKDGTTSDIKRYDLGPEVCTTARWGSAGLFAGVGSVPMLLSFNS